MTLEEFVSTIQDDNPPAGLQPLLLALWYDGHGNWDKSHQITQDIESREAAHIHAYLHRKEGDIWNADYWYKRAGAKRPFVSLETEWKSLVEHLLQQD